jgi:hypothetical protein
MSQNALKVAFSTAKENATFVRDSQNGDNSVSAGLSLIPHRNAGTVGSNVASNRLRSTTYV